MPDIDTDVRLLTAFTREERQELLGLMEGHRPNQRELFRVWLRHPMAGMYGARLRVDSRIVAFAAANLRDGWQLGMVGVYVHPDFRGQELARQALDVLLASVAMLPAEERPEYFVYEEDKARLFRGPIERHGFRDLFAHQAEYQVRRLVATTVQEVTQGGSR